MILANSRALRQHNNDVAAALTTLTAGDSSSNDGGSSSNATTTTTNNEALAVLHSLGVPPEAARDVLGRTGTLRDALNELGLEAPEGAAAGVGSGGGGLAGDDAAAASPGDSDDDSEDSEADSSGGGEELDSEPTPEEKRLFEELAADRENQDDEGYLDITLEDESDAADM